MPRDKSFDWVIGWRVSLPLSLDHLSKPHHFVAVRCYAVVVYLSDPLGETNTWLVQISSWQGLIWFAKLSNSATPVQTFSWHAIVLQAIVKGVQDNIQGYQAQCCNALESVV